MNTLEYSKHYHHHHPTRCIPLIKKLWTRSGEGRTTTTHTHKGERDQKNIVNIIQISFHLILQFFRIV